MKAQSRVKRQKCTSFIKMGIFAIFVLVILFCSSLAVPFTATGAVNEANAVQKSEATTLAAAPLAVTDTSIAFDPKNYGYEWGQIRYTRSTNTAPNFDSAANPENFYVNGVGISLSRGESTGFYDCLVKRGLPNASKSAKNSTFLLHYEVKNTHPTFVNYYDHYVDFAADIYNPTTLRFDVSMVLELGRTYTMVSLNKVYSPTLTDLTKIVVQSNGVARIDYQIRFAGGSFGTTKRYLSPTGFQDNANAGTAATNFAAVPEVKSIEYDGTEKTPYADGANYKVTGTKSGTNAGSYTTTFTLNPGCYWTDGSQSAKTITWKIDPKPVTLSDVKIGETAIESYNSFKDITPRANVSASMVGLIGEDTLSISAVWEDEPSASGKQNITLSSSNDNYIIADNIIPINYYADYYYVGNSKLEESCRVLTNENLASIASGDIITIVGKPKVAAGMEINSSVTIRGETGSSGFDVSEANIEIGAAITLGSNFNLFSEPTGGGITLINGGKLNITGYGGDILNVEVDSTVSLGDVLVIGDKEKINLKEEKTDGEIRFGYEKNPGELLLGGLKITGTSVSADGKITINGSIVGVNENMNVSISDLDGGNINDVTSSATINTDGTFIVNSNVEFSSGKKIVTLTYSVGDYKITSSTLVTIPMREGGSLNGEINFGDLGGDTIHYKDKGGNTHELTVGSDGKGTLPDNVVVDENGNVTIAVKDKTTNKETEVVINVGGGRAETVNNFNKNDIVIRDTTITLATEAGFEYCIEDKNGNIIAGCDWAQGTNGKLIFSVSENTEYVVKARAKGTANEQPGISVNIDVKTKTAAVQNAQDDAKTALDTAAQTAKDQIDNLADLTQDEKNSIKNAIDDSAVLGKNDIDLKDTVDTVNKAKEDAKKGFDNIVNDAKALSAAKVAANEVISTAAQENKNTIDSMTSLSDNDKKKYKDEIDNAVTAAKDSIVNAKNTQEVETAKNELTTAISDIVTEATTLNTDKAEAITAISEGFEANKTKINNLVSAGITVSPEAKAKAIALLQKEYDKAIAAVNGCESSAEAIIAKENGLLNLDKCEAIAEIGISQEYWNKRLQDYVDGASKKLTQAEADEFIGYNNNWYAKAVEDINAATTSGGFAIVAKTANNQMYKESAISDIFYEKKQALNEANKLDNTNPNKAILINDIETAYIAAKDNMLAIDASGFDSFVASVQRISLSERLVINKLQAKAEVELSTQEALKRADKLKEPFKAAEKAKINAAYVAAITAVEGATQADAYGSATTPKKIADVHQIIIDKLGYNAQLLAAKNDACSRLDAYLTNDNAADVAAAKANIAREYETAINNTNLAADTESSKLAMQNGENAIDTVVYTFVVANIGDVVSKIEKDANKILDDLTNLTEEQKTAAKNAIDNAVLAAKDTISAATTLEDIDAAEQALKDTVADIILGAQKDVAKNGLNDLAKTEKGEIDKLTGLTEKDKADAKAAIDNAVALGNNEISVKDNAIDIITAKNAAETEIKKVTTEVAKKTVRDYAEDVKAAITANGSLTAAEKQTAKADVDTLIASAIDAIDNAANSADLNKALASGMDKILDVYQGIVKKEFTEFLKDYTAGGKFADDYDISGKAAIADAKQNGEMIIGNATSIKDLNEKLEIAKDGIISVKPKAPSATVDFLKEQLKGLEPNKEYNVSNGADNNIIAADASGNIPLVGKDSSGNDYNFIGKMLNITTIEFVGVQAASEPTTVVVPARAVTPSPKIDYIDRVVNLGKPNADFTVTIGGEETTVTTNSKGEIILKDEWIGKTISFAENSKDGSSLESLPIVITIEKYWSLSFNYNDGGTTAVKRYTVSDGQTAPIQADPSRNGYIFLGWFKDSACAIEWSFKYGKVNANTVIYAGWQAEHSGVNTVTVTFVAEGKPNETKTIDKNTTIKSQNATAPNGKTFAGWYSDSDFKYKYDFKNKVTENITLYAKFMANKIVVTMPGGTETEINYGDKLVKPSNPTKDGYTFAGWYTDKGCNDVLLFLDGKTKDGITQNITLYPKWVQKTHTVNGTITDEDGKPVANTYITIEIQPSGKTIKTDTKGRFTVTDVPDGNYRIVVKYEKDGSITVVTEAIFVNDADVTVPNISIMGANLNSNVEIGENAPDVVVGGLNDLFGTDKHVSDAEKQKAKVSGNKVELKFVVSDSSKNKLLSDFAAKNKKQIGSYLDFTLFKIMTVNGVESTSYLSNLDSLLKIIIPLSSDMQGKTSYIIYRMHNGEMHEIKIGLENANADGEYLELSSDGKYLTVYTKNFSSYAIAFNEQVEVVASSCFLHWIVLILILLFLILITVFTFLFNKKCLANIITWGVYVVGLFVLMFFVWSCAADIALWIVGVVLAILAALAYFFMDKIREKLHGKEEQVTETKEELADGEPIAETKEQELNI